MAKVNPNELTEALVTLGAALEQDGTELDVVAVGGWALAQLGYVERPTQDVDLIGAIRRGSIEPLDPIPLRIGELIQKTADLHGLEADWLNTGPSFLRTRLPAGLLKRLSPHRYGGLTIWIPGRRAFIFMKVYAAADSPGTRHGQDLRSMAPNRNELRDAAHWAFLQEDSDAFVERLKAIVDDPGSV